MGRGPLVFLLVATLGLGTYWWWKKDDPHNRTVAYDHALFEDFAPEEIFAVRIDNLERAVQIKLERDRFGSWFLTDPVPYPAVDELVRGLIQNVAKFRGRLDPTIDPREAKLDPPLVVLELSQGGETETVHRIEIGAVDLNASLVYVRIPGHRAAPAGEDAAIFRAPRPLYTTLDRNPDDYRDTRATHLLAQHVTAIRRSGELFVDRELGRVSLELDALRDGERWITRSSPRVAFDPAAIGLLVRGAADLRVAGFADDAPGDLARFGLDEPAFRIELTSNRRETVTLLFSHPPAVGDRPVGELEWLAKRVGSEHVWLLDTTDVLLLTRPTDLFYDHQLVRALRQDVVSVEIEGEGRTITISRADGDWSVRERTAQGERGPFPADHGALQDLLIKLEQGQIAEFPPVAGFETVDPPRRFAVRTRSGGLFAGEIGAIWSREGIEGRLFLRAGDGIPGLVPEEIAALCVTPFDELRRRLAHDVKETDLERIGISRGGDPSLDYAQREGKWFPARSLSATVPQAFLLSIDALRRLRAAAWLDEGGALDGEIEVVLKSRQGVERRFALGRLADGRAAFRLPDGACGTLEVGPELLERLESLFGDADGR